LQSPSEE